MSVELIPFVKNDVQLKTSLVVQHNNLIEANYSLTLQEKRVVAWLASQVRPDDIDFKEHTIKVSEFCHLAGISSKNMYKEIDKITDSLLQKVIKIQSFTENIWEKMTWLSYAKYIGNEGKIVLRFEPALKKYLLQLKESFTRIELVNFMKFKSVYALRLYELLKQYQKVGVREICLNDLRQKLGINKEEYLLYGNLKMKVMGIALKEINGKSDICFDFKEIKERKRVVAIKFFIYSQLDRKENSLLRNTESLGISASTLDKFLTRYTQEEIVQGLSVLKAYTGQIKNPALFLKKALEGNWQPFMAEGIKDTIVSELPIEIELKNISETEECKNIRKAFIKREGENEYKSWLGAAEMVLEGTILRVKVRSAFLAQYIQANYISALQEIAQGVEYVEVIVKTDLDVSPVEEEKQKTVDQKKITSTKKSVAPSQRNGKKIKKEPEEEQKKELPPLKQLSLWGRVKTFLSPNS